MLVKGEMVPTSQWVTLVWDGTDIIVPEVRYLFLNWQVNLWEEGMVLLSLLTDEGKQWEIRTHNDAFDWWIGAIQKEPTAKLRVYTGSEWSTRAGTMTLWAQDSQ